MGEITLKGYVCERCGHKWVPANENQPPRVCPKCKSPYWDRPRQRASPRVVETVRKYRGRGG